MDTAKVAALIVRAMERKGYRIDRGRGEVNIIYVEGVTFKDVSGVLTHQANANRDNWWDDVRAALQFVDGKPHVTDWWQATTAPGIRYTMNPVSGAVAEGAARITLGQQACWQVGLHRGYEALAQTGDAVMVTRDKNKDFSREGDKVTKGFYGINQHHGFDAPENDIGPHSAGCLVGRTVKGHKKFMALVKTDPRYLANKKFVFATTILEASEIEGAAAAPSRASAKAPAEPVSVLLDFDADDLRAIFPRAPQKYLDGLVTQKGAFHRSGITATRNRLAYCFAQVEHESGGFTILKENINYSASRAAQVWPNRFPGGAGDVVAKYGVGEGWQKRLMDSVYGGRMGNRPGTHDGSDFIGRSGIQITGRDGYEEIGRRIGVDLAGNPELATEPSFQAPIIAAFWDWKNLNPFADAGDFTGQTKRVNGGTNGLADRRAQLAGNDPIIQRLETVRLSKSQLQKIPGGPSGSPPTAVVNAATKKERNVRNGGAATAGAGGAGEAATAGTQQPDKPAVVSAYITYPLIAIGIVAFVVGAILLARKVRAVRENWA